MQGRNPPREPLQRALPPASPVTKQAVAAPAVPTLFIVGSEDPVVAPELVREVHAQLHRSEYREFKGAGRSVYREQPAEFNLALEAFLAKYA